jgi:hypothetical protein
VRPGSTSKCARTSSRATSSFEAAMDSIYGALDHVAKFARVSLRARARAQDSLEHRRERLAPTAQSDHRSQRATTVALPIGAHVRIRPNGYRVDLLDAFRIRLLRERNHSAGDPAAGGKPGRGVVNNY